MKLLEPYFLYAFLAIAIPILIHLFSLQKHKTVFFSNVSFLRELQQKKSNITKLQKLLLLLIRLLLISAIILAFCEPYFSDKDTLVKTKQIVGVYIDNSFSMEANNDKGQMIEQAKNHARSIIKAHKGKDEFVFLSNNLQGKHQRIIDYNDCLDAIDNCEITPTILNLKSVSTRFKSITKNEINTDVELYLISDFQKTTTPLDLFLEGSRLKTHLLPINSYPQSNLSIDTCYLENPNHTVAQQETLYFKISNTSNEKIQNLTVKLFVNGKQKALSNLTIEAESFTEAKLIFNNHNSGTQKASIELSDATITFDNRLYFSYQVEEYSKVLSIHEQTANKSIGSLFKDQIFNFESKNIGQLNLTELLEKDLVILEDVSNPSTGLINSLKQYTLQGGNLLIIPSININMASFSTLANALNIPQFTNRNTKQVEISTINKNHIIFNEVFEKQVKETTYPEVSLYYSIDNTNSSTEENILQLNTKEPFLNSYKNGLGNIYLQTSPLANSANTLDKHAIFVPLLYNIANQSSRADKLYYTLGKDKIIHLAGKATNRQWILNKVEGAKIIPELRTVNQRLQLSIPTTVTEDGFYKLTDGTTEKNISFNYDRQESNLASWETEELEDICNKHDRLNIWYKEGVQLEQVLKENRSGTPLWRFFILLALLFISIESLLLKNWKQKAQINLEN